jgi:hypothetical protein
MRFRHLSLAVALLFLLGLGFLGGRGGLAEWPQAITPGQRLASVTELLYGVLGLVGGAALLTRRSWTVPVILGWAASVTATAGLAPIVWGGQGLVAGLAAAGATALIAWGIVWLTRRALAA